MNEAGTIVMPILEMGKSGLAVGPVIPPWFYSWAGILSRVLFDSRAYVLCTALQCGELGGNEVFAPSGPVWALLFSVFKGDPPGCRATLG